MYRIVSRIKTNGSYTKCAVTDTECTIYGNKVEPKTYDDIKDAVRFILTTGDKSKIYYICSQYDSKTDLHSRNNDSLDAGNDWFVRQRYCYTNKEWVRICLTTSKPYM